MSLQRPSPPKNPRFRFTTPLVHDDGSPIPAEWELTCPTCGYELTGLSVRRCPECGKRFDPHDIWVARRHKEAGVGQHAPGYVAYGIFGVILLITFPIFKAHPWMALPLGLLPMYELAACFLNRDAAPGRTIVITIVAMTCILVGFW